MNFPGRFWGSLVMSIRGSVHGGTMSGSYVVALSVMGTLGEEVAKRGTPLRFDGEVAV
jgi:hypothetical protein